MAQVIDRSLGFEVAAVSPQELLQAWLAFVPQMTLSAELTAFEHVVSAVEYEVSAQEHYKEVLAWVDHPYERAPEFAVGWLHAMHQDVQRAVWHWQTAPDWLQKYGDIGKGDVYAGLSQQMAAHYQRLVALGTFLDAWLLRYCQQWGIPLPADLSEASSPPADTRGED